MIFEMINAQKRHTSCNEVSRYGKKEAGTGEHLTHLITK